MYKISGKNINSMVVGVRQNFQFFRQKNWFLGNNRGLPFGIGFCITLLVLPNYKNISP